VNKSESGTPYHLAAWGKAVESAYSFSALYFVAKLDQQIVAICPAIKMRSLKGHSSVCSLPYCDLGGILAIDDDSKMAMQNHIHMYCDKNGLKTVEFRESASETLALDDAPTGDKVRMLLSLPDDSESLMTQFKSKLRSQIRKAEKNGLTFQVSNGLAATSSDVDEFYDIIAENMRLLGSPVHSKQWYKSIIQAYGKNVYLALVYSEEIAVGAALVILNDTKAVIPWASTRVQYNRLAPNMLLYWAVLSHATSMGLNEFDFGRSTVGEGTYNFKKQWGCLPQKLEWKHYKHGEPVETAENTSSSSVRNTVASVWQKLPLGITNAVGPKLRKYISL